MLVVWWVPDPDKDRISSERNTTMSHVDLPILGMTFSKVTREPHDGSERIMMYRKRASDTS